MSRFADGLLLLVALALAFWLGSLQGQAMGGAEQLLAAEQREHSVSDQHTAALAAANARNRRAETFRRTLDDENARTTRLLDGLRRSAVRLSVPVVARAGQTCGSRADGDSGAAAGDRDEARAELAPAAAADLVGIARDGNAAIHQLNACIDRYNAVRARFNATRPADAQAQ